MLGLIASLWFFIGLCLFGTGMVGMLEARQRQSWPIARGTVEEGHVLEVLAYGDLEPSFVGVVRYVYSLEPSSAYRGGPRIEGRFESPICHRSADAEELLVRFPVGEPVDVHYDPERPSRSVLGQIASERTFGTWLTIAGLAIAALAWPLTRLL